MTKEQDLQRLEQAVAQIPEVEATLQKQERSGRLLVWLSGVVVVALVGIDLYRQSAPWTDWIELMAFSLLFSTYIPLRRKFEIETTRALLRTLQRAQSFVLQAHTGV